MKTLDRPGLRAVIRDEIEARGTGDLDTLELAEAIVERLNDGQLREVAIKGAREMVGEVLRISRQPRPANDNRSVISEQIMEQRDRLATFFTPIAIGNGPRHVLDCSQDDVRAVIDYYRRVQDGAKVSEGKWSDLLRLAESEGAEVMGDLGADEVRRIFDV